MGLTNFDAVVFDLFGTLIEAPSRRGPRQMAQVLDVDADAFLETWGRFTDARDRGALTTEAAIRAALDSMGSSATPAAMESAVRIRRETSRHSLEAREGAIEMLDALRAVGYAIGLATNCSIE